MVLYKRKQVQVVVNQTPQDPSTEVWYIPATKEWFLNYEDYLARMDYYHKRKFVCEITGNSCLNFFEALESEIKEIKDVENNFPEALKVHILRFLQFNRITRLDQLVDSVYSKFKNNYFPGEYVLLKGLDHDTANLESHHKQRGVIREKVEMADKPTSYLVVRSTDNIQAIVSNNNISRDRNHFTKYLVKTFIKLTMTRSHKIGAPWVLKDRYAKKYNISQDYPRDLKQYQSTTPIDDMDPSTIRHFSTPEPAKAVKSSAPPATLTLLNNQYINTIVDTYNPEISIKRYKKFQPHYLPYPLRARANYPEEAVDADKPSSSTVLSSAGISYARRNMDSDLNIKFDIQNSRPIGNKLLVPENAKQMNQKLYNLLKRETVPKNLSVKQEPVDETTNDIENISIDSQSTDSEVEDSRILPKKEPEEASIIEEIDDEEDDSEGLGIDLSAVDELSIKSNHLINIQEALESWIFINIYHNVLKIDTFTFDDFLYTMGWTQSQYDEYGRSELLDEIWCSVLGAILSNKMPKNEESREAKSKGEIFGLNVNLPPKVSYLNPSPKFEDDDLVNGSESDTENGIKTLGTDDEESESDTEKVNGTKKESEDEVEEVVEVEDDDEDDGDDADDEDEEDQDLNDDEDDENREHNAYQIMNHRGIPWHDRLRKRNFRDGNWQTIILGVLSLVEHVESYKPIIDRVYKILAPLELPATASTALGQFYSKMDINLRFSVLNILCSLLGTSDMIRDYIEVGLSESSRLRKDRLDVMKEERTIEDKARKLHDDIISLRLKAQNIPPELEESFRRKIRFNYNAFDMNEEELALASTNDELKKLCEERKETLVEFSKLRENKKGIERKLAEYDCQRLRCLGKDRLYNRYWWFENNGLPTLHGNADDEDDEDTTTNQQEDEDEGSEDEPLDETYLMGRLWVQGPSIEDINHNLKLQEFSSYQNDSFKAGEWKFQSPDNFHIKELTFENLPQDFKALAGNFGLVFDKQQISRIRGGYQQLIINRLGEVVTDDIIRTLSPAERKLIEECPDPLMNGSNWRYYDKKEDIEAIIRWLNPYGHRESQLKKSLLSAKDAIIHSIEARNKAFANKERIEERNKLKTQISDLNHRILNYEPNEEEESEDDEDIIEIKNGRKRKLRTKPKQPVKRVRKTFEDMLKYGDVEELEKSKDELLTKLEQLSKPFEFIRVIEWVNSFAIEEYGKSLYEGADKFKKR